MLEGISLHKLSPKSVELKPDLWQLLAPRSWGGESSLLLPRLMGKGIAEAPSLALHLRVTQIGNGAVSAFVLSMSKENILTSATIFRVLQICFYGRCEPQPGLALLHDADALRGQGPFQGAKGTGFRRDLEDAPAIKLAVLIELSPGKLLCSSFPCVSPLCFAGREMPGTEM